MYYDFINHTDEWTFLFEQQYFNIKYYCEISKDSTKGTVTDPKTSKETAYKGIFLQLYSDGVASLSDGNLVKTPFN